MNKEKSIFIVLGWNYHSDIKQIEQYLPDKLSKFHKVLCFEYPQFIKTFILIKNGIPILEKINENLLVYHSLAIFPHGRLFPLINKLNHQLNFIILKFLLGKKSGYKTIISFTPEVSLLTIDPTSRLIYHVLDDYKSLPWWNKKSAEKQFNQLEKNTINQSAIIIAVSRKLVEKFKKLHKKVFLYPTPAELSAYLNYRFNKADDINDITRLKKPIAGFIGSGTIPGKLDVELIYNLAAKFPQINFVFIGLYKKSYLDFERFPNLINLGYKERELLPAYVANFDVCLIPYCLNKFGQSAYPVKIMEYLALGKPVVSTALPAIEELAQKKLIYTAETAREFGNKMLTALREKDEKLTRARIREAGKNDWDKRIRQYLNFLY